MYRPVVWSQERICKQFALRLYVVKTIISQKSFEINEILKVFENFYLLFYWTLKKRLFFTLFFPLLRSFRQFKLHVYQ